MTSYILKDDSFPLSIKTEIKWGHKWFLVVTAKGNSIARKRKFRHAEELKARLEKA